MSCKCILTYLMIVGFHFLPSRASEWCNVWESDEFFCADGDNSVAYCCNYYNFDYHNCCQAIYVWSLWYFWLGLIGGLLCLTAFSAGIYYCWKAKRNANRNRETRLATITQNNTVSEPTTQIKMVDVPPSYEFVVTQQSVPGQLYTPPEDPPTPNHFPTMQASDATQTSLVYENTPTTGP